MLEKVTSSGIKRLSELQVPSSYTVHQEGRNWTFRSTNTQLYFHLVRDFFEDFKGIYERRNCLRCPAGCPGMRASSRRCRELEWRAAARATGSCSQLLILLLVTCSLRCTAGQLGEQWLAICICSGYMFMAKKSLPNGSHSVPCALRVHASVACPMLAKLLLSRTSPYWNRQWLSGSDPEPLQQGEPTRAGGRVPAPGRQLRFCPFAGVQSRPDKYQGGPKRLQHTSQWRRLGEGLEAGWPLET